MIKGGNFKIFVIIEISFYFVIKIRIYLFF